MIKDKVPDSSPKAGTHERRELIFFCQEVDVILLTVNEIEYQAAVTMMEPPSETFQKSTIFPSKNTVVGNFANHKAALIWTSISMNSLQYATDTFPNAKVIIVVGYCTAFNKEKWQLGDVIVSKNIVNVNKFRFNQSKNFQIKLFHMFSELTFDKRFGVTLCRSSHAHPGKCSISVPDLTKNKQFEDFISEVKEKRLEENDKKDRDVSGQLYEEVNDQDSEEDDEEETSEEDDEEASEEDDASEEDEEEASELELEDEEREEKDKGREETSKEETMSNIDFSIEGCGLLEFQKKQKIDGFLIIKGVSGYYCDDDDDDKMKTRDWQFTAAKAAVQYTMDKLKHQLFYEGKSITS